MKHLLFFFAFVFCISAAFGQDYKKIDSLRSILITNHDVNNNENKELELCIEIGDLYETSDPDSAIYWYLKNADTSFTRADVLENKSWQRLNAKAIRYAAYVLKNKNEFSKSLLYYHKSIEIYKLLGDKEDQANCYVNISEIKKKQGDVDAAVIYYVYAVRLMEELNNLQKASDYLNNIGVMLYNAGRYNEAIQYYKHVLDLSKKNNETSKTLKYLYLIGNSFYKLEKHEEALEYFLQVTKNENEDNKYKLPSLEYAGHCFFNIHDYSKAAEYYIKAQELSEQTNPLTDNYFQHIAIAYEKQNQYKEAVKYYKRGYDIALANRDSALISEYLLKIGVAESNNGNYFDGIRFIKKSMEMALTLNDKSLLSDCFAFKGFAEYLMDNKKTALEDLHKAQIGYKELNDTLGLAKTHIHTASVYLEMAQYPRAIMHVDSAIQYNQAIGNKQGLAACYSLMGQINELQGNTALALTFYQRQLDIAERIKSQLQSASAYSGMGKVYSVKKDFDLAVFYYQKSLKIYEEIDLNIGISGCLNNIGAAESGRKNFDLAGEYYAKALKIYEEINSLSGIAITNKNIGIIAKARNAVDEEIVYYEKAIKIRQKINENVRLSADYTALAKAYLKKGRTTEASDLFAQAVNNTVNLLKENFVVLSESEKEMFLEVTKNVFNEYKVFVLSNGKPSDQTTGICYNNELLLKGLLLKSSSFLYNSGLNSDNENVKQLYLQLKQIRKQISEVSVSNSDFAIDSLKNEANQVEKNLAKASSEYVEFQSVFSNEWKTVQNSLEENEAAIEFFTYTNGEENDTVFYAALIITPECKSPCMVKLFSENDLLGLIGNNYETGYKYINRIYSTENESLYRLIWLPLETQLGGIGSVYYSPAGILNKLSVAALSINNDSMLCDRYILFQLNSTAKISESKQNKFSVVTAGLFGGIDYNDSTQTEGVWKYLPGTLTEIKTIEKVLKKSQVKFTTLTGIQASEKLVKEMFTENVKSPHIVHISTHGFFYPDPSFQSEKENESGETDVQFRGSSGFGNWMFVNNKNPMMRSGLVFAGANRVWSEDWGRTDNEGVLTAYEVSNMNMRNTDLVVLSACETGLGDIRGSEGVYGLQRAFKMAGVKYIIMSLWQVPDKETVEFMETFYKKLLKSKDVRKSFNETQKEMRKKYDPYYWGAFVLIE